MRIITPSRLAAASFITGCGLLIGGIYVLQGLGWALIAGSVPPIAVALIFFRGIIRG